MKENELSVQKMGIDITSSKIAAALDIKDDDGMRSAVALVRGIKEIEQEISDHCAPSIKVAHELHKRLLADKHALIGNLPQVRKDINKAITDYRKRKAEQEKQQMAKALANAVRLVESGGDVTEIDLPAKQTAPKGVCTRRQWKWKVTDLHEVPREFLMLDDAAVSDRVRKLGKDANIPGIDVYQEEKTIIRRDRG